jgi:hypothetical protein
MVLRNSSMRAREEEGDEGLIGARAAAVMRRGYDEDRWWRELNARVEEGERERESSLVRGKGVGETGGGAHTFIGAGGAGEAVAGW